MSGRHYGRGSAENKKIIDKKNLCEFVKELTSGMRKEFYGLLKNLHIKVEKVHPQYDIEIDKKAFLGKFHSYFVQKVIYNKKEEDWQSETLSSYASIFPFKVSKNVVDEVNLDIFEIFDSEFKNNVTQFLKKHFDVIEEIDDLIKLFLGNIHASTTNKTQIGPCGESGGADNVEKLNHSLDNMKLADGVPNVPRLNEKGVRRYQHLYNLTRQAMQSFCPSQAEMINFDKYDESYFRNLPKNNMDELYSLLDSKFYKENGDQYTKLFEKYLFFFLHALRSEEKPVFFIDELLYECLKSLRIFQTSPENPVNLKSHIANLTCVYQRLQHSNRDSGFVVSDTSLEKIKKFFETDVRGIDTAQINYSTEDAPLKNRTFACTDHEAFVVCFSNSPKDKPLYFIELIIEAAFSKKYFNTLSIYNVYRGTKTWMYNPGKKEEILNFVRKYSKYEPKELPSEYFIMEGFEECFELNPLG